MNTKAGDFGDQFAPDLEVIGRASGYETAGESGYILRDSELSYAQSKSPGELSYAQSKSPGELSYAQSKSPDELSYAESKSPGELSYAQSKSPGEDVHLQVKQNNTYIASYELLNTKPEVTKEDEGGHASKVIIRCKDFGGETSRPTEDELVDKELVYDVYSGQFKSGITNLKDNYLVPSPKGGDFQKAYETPLGTDTDVAVVPQTSSQVRPHQESQRSEHKLKHATGSVTELEQANSPHDSETKHNSLGHLNHFASVTSADLSEAVVPCCECTCPGALSQEEHAPQVTDSGSCTYVRERTGAEETSREQRTDVQVPECDDTFDYLSFSSDEIASLSDIGTPEPLTAIQLSQEHQLCDLQADGFDGNSPIRSDSSRNDSVTDPFLAFDTDEDDNGANQEHSQSPPSPLDAYIPPLEDYADLDFFLSLFFPEE